MGKIKVVLDSNVLISALGWDDKPKECFDLVLKVDPPDNRVLGCALEADADFIVSGDSHLLDLEEFRGIEILSPDEFLEVFER